MSEGLTGLSRPDLEALLDEVELGRVVCPLTEAGLQAAGLEHLVGRLGVLDGAGREGVVASLRVALAERDRRPRTTLELVWSGPEARVSGARDTAVVVRQLFERAQREVLVAGYAFDHAGDILQPLHDAMAQRGVSASLFVNLEGRASTPIDVERAAASAAERFLDENWPFGEPTPELYYDPRTVTYGAGASLHAKCIVVDGRLSLVGSANFTDRGQRRSLEAGVLIDDATFVNRLLAQWRGLITAGLVRKYLLLEDE